MISAIAAARLPYASEIPFPFSIFMMKIQENVFAVQTVNGELRRVGRSFIIQPRIQFKGGKTNWFDDSRLIKKGEK